MTRIVAMSDTHNRHAELTVPEGDILIHCGDFSNLDVLDEMHGFLDWMSELPHRVKLLVPGNHDSTLERALQDYSRYHDPIDLPTASCGITLLSGLGWQGHYVHNDPDGRLRIAGATWSWVRNSRFRAFSAGSEAELEPRWAWLELGYPVDILVTHVPPAGILDLERGISWGSSTLKDFIEKQPPALHLFGHVHACGGQNVRIGQTIHANVACCGPRYAIEHPPAVFDVNAGVVTVVEQR